MDIKTALINSYSNPQRVTEALLLLSQATAENKIYNVDFESIKLTLNRAIEKLYNDRISQVYYWGGLWEKLGEEEDSLSDGISVTTIPSILSAAKKVNAYKGEETQFIKDLREVITGAAEIATQLKDLKPFIVKGRKPSGKAPAPENPNKIVKTCACCFRAIAVGSDGKMVHHGYRRPGDGFQTNSCMGISYRPLEVSDEGLRAVTQVYAGEIVRLNKALADLAANAETIVLKDWKGREVQPGTPEHRREISNTQYRLESELRSSTSYHEKLTEMLANWKPE